MVKESWSIITIASIKAIGRMTTNMERAMRSFPMELSIRENISMANLKELESTTGLMDNFIRGSGSMDSNMGRVCGREPKEIAMWASGEWAKLKDMESMSGSMEIAMKDSSKIV